MEKGSLSKGSLSIEAIIAVPILILVVFTLSLLLKIIYVYDAIDQSVFNAAEQISINESYATFAHSDGVVEQNLRPLIVEGFVKSSVKGLEFDSEADAVIGGGLESIEVSEVDFHDSEASGEYSISYSVPLIGGLKPIKLMHNVRIRSIWQFALEVQSDNPSLDNDPIKVYTSPHGRKNGIYHTDPDCTSLLRSWKKPDSVQISDVDTLENYRECKICAKGHASNLTID